jgi:hypothetical protein
MLWAASMANIRYDSRGSPVINSASDYLAYQAAKEEIKNQQNKKGYCDFLEDFSSTESGGTYNIRDQYTGDYLGKYQVGYQALMDTGYVIYDLTLGPLPKDTDVIWTEKSADLGVISVDDFLNNVGNIQEIAIADIHKKTWGYLENNGATDYVGQTINGIYITNSGLLAAALSLGASGIKNELDNNNINNATDGAGNSVSYYFNKFQDYDISYIIEGE